VTLEKTIEGLTAKTGSGGFFLIGENITVVWYGRDWWEWEYRGNTFYDAKDLADDVIRRNRMDSRLVRFFTGHIPDQRRVARG
jgi:hypothetical protein